MNAGDLILWACLILIVLGFAICAAIALHRSFTGPADRSEYDEYWRRDGKR